MNIADHPRPCMSTPPDAMAMTVNLERFGMPDRYERLIVTSSPEGNYVVACLPFFTYGIQFGDLVEVSTKEHAFERVLKHSGLRTLRFAFNDSKYANEVHEELHDKLLATGLPHEWHEAGYLAVLLRNVHDQELAWTCFGKFVEDGNGSCEVDPEPFV